MREVVLSVMMACVLSGGSAVGQPLADQPPAPDNRTLFRPMLKIEAEKSGLPLDIADAVVSVESAYDPSRIGSVGEVGLMQVRLETAAMLGFKGTAADLADPATNIHFGVAYLSEAWRQAAGDLCRALMKYRAGHGEDRMSALSVLYCERAKAHLASIGSPQANAVVPAADFIGAKAVTPVPDIVRAKDGSLTRKLRVRTAAVSAAFWAAHEARIKAINARIDRRWRTASSQ